MPPLSGINHLGRLKPNAQVFGQSAGDRVAEPIMVGSEVGSGRVLAFGGETWVWARASNEARSAHRKFWRQVIFWLAHKEDKGENEVKLTLDARRIAVGPVARLPRHRPRRQGRPRSPGSSSRPG